jgi:hypothetical protein
MKATKKVRIDPDTIKEFEEHLDRLEKIEDRMWAVHRLLEEPEAVTANHSDADGMYEVSSAVSAVRSILYRDIDEVSDVRAKILGLVAELPRGAA